MFDSFMFVGEEITFYLIGAAMAFFAVCAVTTRRFTRSRRNMLRAAVFALLLTPTGFGVHDVYVLVPPVFFVLPLNEWSLLALVMMSVTGVLVFGLLSALSRTVHPIRELAAIGAVLAGGAVIVASLMAISSHQAERRAIASRQATLQHAQQHVREEASGLSELAFTQDIDGIIVLSRPAEFTRDYALTPLAPGGVARFRLDASQASAGAVVSVRNPRTQEWTTVSASSTSSLPVRTGDTLLVSMEHVDGTAARPANASAPVHLSAVERLQKTEESGNVEDQ